MQSSPISVTAIGSAHPTEADADQLARRNTRNGPHEKPAPAQNTRAAHNVIAPLLILLPLGVALAANSAHRLDVPSPATAGPNADELASRINPNTAPWWELAALPRIGAATARRIIETREAHQARDSQDPPFAHPADLQRVRGIGPKTVHDVQPHLTFTSGRTESVTPHR